MNVRYTATFLGIVGVVTGAIAAIAAYTGDTRLGTPIAAPTMELGWGIAVVAVALVLLAVGAFLASYRPLYGAGLMAVAVLAVLVAQWADISQYIVDLWTSGTGGTVMYMDPAFADPNKIARPTDFWGVLGGSVAMLGYAGTVIFGVAASAVAAFAPEPEAVEERRPATKGIPA
jgi:hypothetical protein